MMPTSPSARLDATTLWAHLQRLIDRVTAAMETEHAVDDALDVVVELLGADHGFLLLHHEDGTTSVLNARAARPLTAAERDEANRTIVKQAIESDGVAVIDAGAQPDASSSLAPPGVGVAMAAPVGARGRRRGVLYVDFRDPTFRLEPAHRELFMAAAALTGGLIEQAGTTRAARDRLLAAHAHVTESRRTPPVDELLAEEGMKRARADVELAVATDSPVLVLGESGTGKTLLAQSIAEASLRVPIVRLVLGSSDDLNTITSELFGHERGAFSGAAGKRIGLVEYASGGTLILDELLNLPPHAQKLLLDFTQFGTYRPLGYDKAEPKRATVRILAVTNGDMREAIRDKRFREDLYYRLAGITIRLPPLRERRQDIVALAERTLRSLDPSRSWKLAPGLRRSLASSSYAWPGNVRELEWVMRRARDRAIVRDPAAGEIGGDDLVELAAAENVRGPSLRPPPAMPPPVAKALDPAEAWRQLQHDRGRLDEREVEILREALARHDGVVAHAAKDLGVPRTTLASRLDALGLGRASRG